MTPVLLPKNDHHLISSPARTCDAGDARDDHLNPLINKKSGEDAVFDWSRSSCETAELCSRHSEVGFEASRASQASLLDTLQVDCGDAHAGAPSRQHHITATPSLDAECCRAFGRPSSAARHASKGVRLQSWLQTPPALPLPINCAGCGAVLCSTIDNPCTEVMSGR
jgi:hypothetical protein